MMVLQLIAGIVLDLWLGEVHRYHPLAGFGGLANRVDHAFKDQSPWRNKLTGLFSVIFLVGTLTLLSWGLIQIPVVGVIFSVIFFYLCLGAKSLSEHANKVYQLLLTKDLTSARMAVGLMVSRDTASMNGNQVSLACIESVLENGNDAVFATIFWFTLLGAPGAVAYRLVNTLDAMWGYRTARYQQFGWAAARLDDLLNWAPARLCALTYALQGEAGSALNCWQQQAPAWESPNAGPVMATGAGALNIQLGGVGIYHGQQKFRPPLGKGCLPVAKDIQRAIKLVQNGVIVWVLAITMIFITGTLIHA